MAGALAAVLVAAVVMVALPVAASAAVVPVVSGGFTSDQTTEPADDTWGTGAEPTSGETTERPNEDLAVEDPATVDDPAPSDAPDAGDPTTSPAQGAEPTSPEPGEETTTVEQAELSLQASMSPTVVTQDEPVTLTLVVSNTGSAADSGVTVSDALPAGAVLLSTTADLDEQSGVVTVPPLEADEVETIQISVTFPNAVGEMVATPTVQSSTAGVSGDQASTAVEVLPTVPGAPDSTEPTAAPGTPTSGTDPTESGDGTGSTDPGPTGSDGPAVSDGPSSSAGPTQDASPGANQPGSGGSDDGRPGAGQQGSGDGRPGTGQGSGDGRPGAGQQGSGDGRPGGDSTTSPTSPDRDGRPKPTAGDPRPSAGSLSTAEPSPDQLTPAWGQSAVLMLGVLLIVAGCALLVVGGVRRIRFWS